MGAIERMTVTMPAEMAAALKKTVAEGEYATTSEVVREALREWTRARGAERRGLETLRDIIRIGDESGPSVPADEVYAELRRLIEERRVERA